MNTLRKLFNPNRGHVIYMVNQKTLSTCEGNKYFYGFRLPSIQSNALSRSNSTRAHLILYQNRDQIVHIFRNILNWFCSGFYDSLYHGSYIKMVTQKQVRTGGVVIWSVSSISIDRDQSQICFFFFHICALYSELSPNKSTMVLLYIVRKFLVASTNLWTQYSSI